MEVVLEREDIGDEEVEWGALPRPPSVQAYNRVGLREDNHDRPRARRLHLIRQSVCRTSTIVTDSLQSHAIQSQVPHRHAKAAGVQCRENSAS